MNFATSPDSQFRRLDERGVTDKDTVDYYIIDIINKHRNVVLNIISYSANACVSSRTHNTQIYGIRG